MLVVGLAVAAVLTVVGLAAGTDALTYTALAVAIAFAGLLAAYLIVTERRRHEAVEEELTSEARFLESLVETMGSVAQSTDVLERTRVEAERLFEANVRLLQPGEQPSHGAAENAIVIPLRSHGEDIGALRLTRQRPFDRDDVVRATVLADFAAREHENAELLEEARDRETERSRLSDQLLTAEQEERRRLANELHDGAVQSLSGVALLLDAGLNSIGEGRSEEAQRHHRARARAPSRDDRPAARISPSTSSRSSCGTRGSGRPCGRSPDQIALEQHMQVDLDVSAADRMAEKTQAALYQIIREALNQAVRRGPPTSLSVTMRETDGGVETTIADDAPGERRRSRLEELSERARTLNGFLTVHQGESGGTTVRVVLPTYAAAR